jgi:hypothetical protein
MSARLQQPDRRRWCEGGQGGLRQQAITAILQKSTAPLANGVFMDAEFGSRRFAWQAIRTSQNRAASLR